MWGWLRALAIDSARAKEGCRPDPAGTAGIIDANRRRRPILEGEGRGRPECSAGVGDNSSGLRGRAVPDVCRHGTADGHHTPTIPGLRRRCSVVRRDLEGRTQLEIAN